MGFGGDIKLWQDSTANRQELIDAIARLKQPGWGTRFFDALYSACDGRLAATGDGKLVHRAIVVLTDGDDTQSIHSLGNVIAAAQRNEIQIYALTIHSLGVTDRGDRILQRLADATGGRLYVAPSSRDLGAAFAQIEQDLRTQYYVSFPRQQAAPGYHALRIEVRPAQKLEVHAASGLLRHGGVGPLASSALRQLSLTPSAKARTFVRVKDPYSGSSLSLSALTRRIVLRRVSEASRLLLADS